jgi:hypothetical protein
LKSKKYTLMETTEKRSRVRRSTHDTINHEIDKRILKNINKFKNLSKEEITRRLRKTSKEWDIERVLEVNASTLAILGLFLHKFARRRWIVISGTVTGFLLQHGLQGWCPPLPLFRKLGIRTRTEINEEIYALKILRGDFDNISNQSHPEEILRTLRMIEL